MMPSRPFRLELLPPEDVLHLGSTPGSYEKVKKGNSSLRPSSSPPPPGPNFHQVVRQKFLVRFPASPLPFSPQSLPCPRLGPMDPPDNPLPYLSGILFAPVYTGIFGEPLKTSAFCPPPRFFSSPLFMGHGGLPLVHQAFPSRKGAYQRWFYQTFPTFLCTPLFF